MKRTLPPLFRRTPFRLTILFLALFATAASAVLAYVYVASASEARARAQADVRREMQGLISTYEARGLDALNAALVERTVRGGPYLYLLMDSARAPITGNLDTSPIPDFEGAAGHERWESFRLRGTDARGRLISTQALGAQVRLSGGEMLFVGEDIGDTEAYLDRLTRALWGAMGLVLVMGIGGGLLLSRNMERSMARLNAVLQEVKGGNLKARARVRGSGDEFDELGEGLNAMLDRLQASMESIRHAGDAIAHDLRSPLTRMRAKLEVALIDAEAGRADGPTAVETALNETDDLLKTFNAVLAISRLQAAGKVPDPVPLNVSLLMHDMCELFGPAAEDKGLEFSCEATDPLTILGNQGFLSQALANIIDNAIKYTPAGGAVKLRARRRSNGEIELSVTDTGPGVAPEDRERVTQRFVRLENSRNAPGSGLGLSLVSAVVAAHGGRIQIDEGPGAVPGSGLGPGLRVALVFPEMKAAG